MLLIIVKVNRTQYTLRELEFPLSLYFLVELTVNFLVIKKKNNYERNYAKNDFNKTKMICPVIIMCLHVLSAMLKMILTKLQK